MICRPPPWRVTLALAPPSRKAKPWGWTRSVSPSAPAVRGTVIENDLVASGSADAGSTVTSKSENVAVRARRSPAMLVSLARPAVVTGPKRTGPAGCGWEAGGLAGGWPGWVLLPAWLPPFLGAEAFAAESLGREAFDAESLAPELLDGEAWPVEPFDERDGPEPSARAD
jgi:hypothetical protein